MMDGAPLYPERPRREQILDLLFPPLCVGCRRVGHWICARCWREVAWLDPSERTERPPHSPLSAITAITRFDGSAREAVHALKFEGHHAISGVIGRLMAGAAPDGDVVAHVALHPARRRERGYDQSAMLAAVIARSRGLPKDDALRRTRRTQQQANLDRDRRHENVRGAFEARHDMTGKRVILVDDVCTTGATLEAAAEALRAAGAERVAGLVFARAM